MSRSSLYAFATAVSVVLLCISSSARAQARSSSAASQHIVAAARIVDGISLGIRKSHQGETELWIEANDLKATILTRSEGKLFREHDMSAGERTLERQEIAVAFE